MPSTPGSSEPVVPQMVPDVLQVSEVCSQLQILYKIVKHTLGQSPTSSTVSILVIVDVTCVNKTLSGTRTYSIVSTLSGDQEACSYQCPSQPLGDYLRYVVSYQTVTKKTKNTLLRPSPSSLTLTHTVPVPIYAL